MPNDPTIERWDVLRSIARLNAAVWRTRIDLRHARLVAVHQRDETRKARDAGLLAGMDTRMMRVAEASLAEADAEAALASAVASWKSHHDRLRDASRALIPQRHRSTSHPSGHGLAETVAALVERFGEPDEISKGTARWTRDVRADGCTQAERRFGVSDEDGRVMVYGQAEPRATWRGAAEVRAWVSVEASLAWDIEFTHLYDFTSALPARHDERPNPMSPMSPMSPRYDDSAWRAWSFDAPESPVGLLRRAGQAGPMLTTPALASEALAIMLEVPRPRASSGHPRRLTAAESERYAQELRARPEASTEARRAALDAAREEERIARLAAEFLGITSA